MSGNTSAMALRVRTIRFSSWWRRRPAFVCVRRPHLPALRDADSTDSPRTSGHRVRRSRAWFRVALPGCTPLRANVRPFKPRSALRLLFDCDGVVVETEELHRRARNVAEQSRRENCQSHFLEVRAEDASRSSPDWRRTRRRPKPMALDRARRAAARRARRPLARRGRSHRRRC